MLKKGQERTERKTAIFKCIPQVDKKKKQVRIEKREKEKRKEEKEKKWKEEKRGHVQKET